MKSFEQQLLDTIIDQLENNKTFMRALFEELCKNEKFIAKAIEKIDVDRLANHLAENMLRTRIVRNKYNVFEASLVTDVLRQTNKTVAKKLNESIEKRVFDEVRTA